MTDYTIKEITTVFEGVSRIKAISINDNYLDIDVHNNFFNFYPKKNSKNEYINSVFNFNISITEPNVESVKDISYLMTGYKISSDIVSCGGLLVKTNLILNIPDTTTKVYCVIKT